MDNPDLLGPLVEESVRASDERRPFRERSNRVGAVYSMDYSRAVVAIFDFHRERAGGLSRCGFLVAAKPEGDEGFILLRALGDAKLPNAAANDLMRQQGIEDSSNESPWAGHLDTWTKSQVGLHAVECRILGTFSVGEDGAHKYAEDTDNYYAVNELMVWKPDQETLDLIVNHRHRTNAISAEGLREQIGKTRFAAAEKADAVRARLLLDPTDMLRRRTVYLGMSRSGKSNAMKITAERIFRLRGENPEYRIGQLIFDPNGEYAQDNPQDGAGLHRVHEALGLRREDEVETYGLFVPPTDRERKVMRLNFFGDPLPHSWEDGAVVKAVEQMLAGREIIREIMADRTSQYMAAYRDADLSAPEGVADDIGAQVRYRRAVLVHQAALAAAGLERPAWNPSVKGLFGKEVIAAMKADKNGKSDGRSRYHEAALALERALEEDGRISWDKLGLVLGALEQFISDKKSHYEEFEKAYVERSSSGDRWADPRFRSLLRIFLMQNGPRSFQRAQEQHAPGAPQDFAEMVVGDLRAGKLVIVDQSTGDPEQNRQAAERIMWKVFRTQQEEFKRMAAAPAGNGLGGHVLVYIEEAHNLLPKAREADNLRTVWARSAKEGSKMNIGMVLATQAPSSIMPEILSETDNWILAYLNSENERRVIAGYMDFEDFIDQIGQVSEPGFARVRTLSLAYTVPVQFDKFDLGLEPRT